jgi:putative NADPH-quinone reductase
MNKATGTRKILLIDAHPAKSTFCDALAGAYEQAAKEAGFDLKRRNLRDFNFDLNLRQGYQTAQPLEVDLLEAQQAIRWCEHLVIVYPIWWGSMPALLKGFLDRCLLPGFAFKYHEKGPFWDKLLAGRSARIIVTSDAPAVYTWLAYGNAPYKAMEKAVLKFCGFNPIKRTAIDRVRFLTESERSKVLTCVRKLGRRGD